MIAFVNNRFMEEAEAVLQVSDLALQRGYGVFDYFRTKNNIPLFLNDYLDRFYNSAQFLHLKPLYERVELAALIGELINKNNLPESGIKILLTGGYSGDGYELSLPNLVITQQELPQLPPNRFDEGVKVISYQYQREFAAVKSINYLMGVWLQNKIKDGGAADVLYYKNGIVTEFPRSNVFMVTQDGKIVTPRDHILHGITRKKLLEIAVKNYPVEVRAIDMEEIKSAAEVFMTSTTKRVLPVCRIDDTVIGCGKAGPVAIRLTSDFIAMEEQVLNQSVYRTRFQNVNRISS